MIQFVCVVLCTLLHLSAQSCVHPITPPIASSPLPANTPDVLDSCVNSPNGLQNIRVKGNSIVQLYCFNRKEYLLLPNAGGTTGKNFATVQTYFYHYCAIRLDPSTLLVDVGDSTFSTRTGTFSGWNDANFAPYGSASECRHGFIGTANVNTRDTPFIVEPTWQWKRGGFAPRDDSVTRSDENYNLDITGAGFCGYNTPGTAVHPHDSLCRGSFSLGLVIKDVPTVKPCPQATNPWWLPYSKSDDVSTCPLTDTGRRIPKPRFDANCVEQDLNCFFNAWSTYSACSGTCRDAGLPVPTRTRVATVINGTCTDYVETLPCSTLPACPTTTTTVTTTVPPTTTTTVTTVPTTTTTITTTVPTTTVPTTATVPTTTTTVVALTTTVVAPTTTDVAPATTVVVPASASTTSVGQSESSMAGVTATSLSSSTSPAASANGPTSKLSATTVAKPTTIQATTKVSVGATAVGMSTGGTTVGVEASSLHASTSSRAQNDSSTLVENQSSTVNLVVTDNVLSSSAEDYLFYLYIAVPVFVVCVLIVIAVVCFTRRKSVEPADSEQELYSAPSYNTLEDGGSIYTAGPPIAVSTPEYHSARYDDVNDQSGVPPPPAESNNGVTYALAPSLGGTLSEAGGIYAAGPPPMVEAGGIYAAGPPTIDSIYSPPPAETR